ncbi:MAG: hypothetical protein R3E01_33880 [Pirellulaceae bacterium]|nr:hypothetical protein [Planctomycetales bacterium]
MIRFQSNNASRANLASLLFCAGCICSVAVNSAHAIDSQASAAALNDLRNYLAREGNVTPETATQAFADTALTADDARAVIEALWQTRKEQLREERQAEFQAKQLQQGDLSMPFDYTVFGDKPAAGRSLFISMHGGGGAPKRVNDQQWENQKKLYQLDEGVYVAPRAPTDSWNLWHQAHIDELFTRLITDFVVFEEVNPNRVYITGYSAGGDGVYQLAPRMADQLAAAGMMAGHPNETSPLGLRNLPFALHVGALDAAYDRNKVAGQWKEKLAELQRQDPDGYVHDAQLHEGRGHWMNREEAAALKWMAQYDRQRFPTKIVWVQDDVTHHRFYWLNLTDADVRQRTEIIASRDGQTFSINAPEGIHPQVLLSDEFVDLDQPLTIKLNGEQVFAGTPTRTISVAVRTLLDRDDPAMTFSAMVSTAIAPTAASEESRTP